MCMFFDLLGWKLEIFIHIDAMHFLVMFEFDVVLIICEHVTQSWSVSFLHPYSNPNLTAKIMTVVQSTQPFCHWLEQQVVPPQTHPIGWSRHWHTEPLKQTFFIKSGFYCRYCLTDTCPRSVCFVFFHFIIFF